MTALFSAMQATPTGFTHNGMSTLVTTGSDLLDVFGVIGNRTFHFNTFYPKLSSLHATDKALLGRVLLWSRDCRGGAGHRDPIRNFILKFENIDTEYVIALAKRLPELGYYKDLIYLFEKSTNVDLKTSIIDTFIVELHNAVQQKRNSLLAKYLPRKGELAVKFRNELKLSPKEYRKLIVQLSKTVEQQMCANDWDNIKFEQVPSNAMMRYRKAFERHTASYKTYLDKVSKGEVKINSSQLNPGEIVAKIFNGVSDTEDQYLGNAWDALPNYVEGDDKWLPVIDVSGSMYCPAGSRNLQCVHVAIGLGLYLAERNEGLFKNQFITFSERPQVVDLKNKKFNSFGDKINYIKKADWGYNTDIAKVFDLVLTAAVNHNLSEDDMPNKLVIFSDMEFDSATGRRGSAANERILKMIETEYAEAGYKMPQLVFWNLNGRDGNCTVNMNDKGACQISGYTTAILKNLSNLEKFTPMSVMMETISSPRYDF